MNGIAAGGGSRDGEHRIFANVGFACQPDESFDLTVHRGRIASIESHRREAEWILFPPFADLHVHANRAYTAGPIPPSSFEHAIRMAFEAFRDFSEADYARQAERLFAQALSRGTTQLRTHADIDMSTGLKAVRGTLEARERFAGALDVEVVAFASSACDPIHPSARAALREACALGATLLGATPAYYADPRASIDALLDLAIQLDVGVDVHLDEHLDAARSCSAYLATATRSRGLDGRVTLSHGCAISALDPDQRARVIEELVRARITVICLPMTNLYLQDRNQGGTPLQRGLPPLRDLARAGVPLRFASDNVRDAFLPYGAADLLDVAQLIVLAAHLDDPPLLVRGLCGGREGVRVGEDASFVLVRGSSLAQVIAERPSERIVLRHGLQHKLITLYDHT